MPHTRGALVISGRMVGGCLLLPLMMVAGCFGPIVTVVPSSAGVKVAVPKPRDCQVNFHRTQVERPYDEIAALHASGGDSFKNGPEDFQEALRRKACELGADAVLVTQDFTGPGGIMNAVAIRYRVQATESR